MTQQPTSLLKSLENLSPDFFYFKSNSLLYRAALENIYSIKKIKVKNFLVNLKAKHVVNNLNKLNEVLTLIDQAPLSDITTEYSAVIIDTYIKRLLLVSGDTLCLISGSNKPIEQNNITSIVSQLTKVYEILDDKKTQTLATILANLLDYLDKNKKINISGSVSSGFLELDSITQGFQKSDLIILAGRPSMGKTAFAINVTRYIINRGRSYVILFSLEMSTEQLLRRILAQECNLNGQKLQSGQLSDDEWKYIINKSRALADLNLYIDDSSNISTDSIKTKAKFFELQGKKIELIIIDYLQLLQAERQFDNKSQELSLITRSLKILAKDLNLPILVLSQLNRNIETRSDKRPLLSDLRESGCISKFNYLKTSLSNQIKILFSFQYKNIKICNFTSQKLKLFTTSNAQISKTGKKTIYEIITESGKYIKLTSNHRLLTSRGWKRCDKIHKNDMIAIQINTFEGKKTFFDSFLLLTFENIKEMNLINLQVVFDLNCKSLYNFIANSFIIHNSIEQDADLVIMLYRESYYTQETKENDLTEVIVAKHRNGPTGTFQLKFNSQLANFSNY